MTSSTRPRALVVGGTGPTGIWIVHGLVGRGYDVTILHRGTHEREETPAVVEHLHADPYDAEQTRAALDGRTFDVTVAMYGRLRRLAEIMAGRTGQFVSVGGVPAYRGWMNAWLFDPPGLPVPVGEDAETVREPGEDEKGYRVVTHRGRRVRAPSGRRALPVPVRVRSVPARAARVVDRETGARRAAPHHRRRRRPHAAPSRLHREPRARGAARGRPTRRRRREGVQRGDEEVLSVRQVVSLVAAALGHEFDIVSMPYELAIPARPLLAQPLPTHRVLDLTRLKSDLGYHDVVPAREAVQHTARWLAANPIEPGAQEETVLTDPFDYAAEDELVDEWHPRSSGSLRCTSPRSRSTAWPTAAPAAGPEPGRSSSRECPERIGPAVGRACAGPVDRGRRARTRPRCSPTRART